MSDGYWIIIVGMGGWVRYLAEFGLFALPILLLARRARAAGTASAAVALVMAASLVDLIPNATMTPLVWLMAGALWGRVETVGAGAPAAAAQEPSGGRGDPSRGRSASPAAARRTAVSREGTPTRFTRFASRPGRRT